ncbi:hypothetical protein AMECASPLE_013307 [Ameca splendens]|uniref:Optineurin n=1 Tax=Ameca splendens TaxID=208324 RepID=A0ABV0XQ66_9TELE
MQEENMEQVNVLIQLNRDLKAAPRQTNLTMKEYFEGLTAWKERQQRGQQVMECQLEETRHSVETLTLQNQELKEWLTTAEEALAAKQKKIDEMKEEMFQKELKTLSVLRAQAEVYSSDFYAEQLEREKLHKEKVHLVPELENLIKQNTRLQEEMDSMGRRSLNAVQHRQELIGARPPGADAPQIGEGAVGNHRNIGKLVFPMCSESFQNMDSIRIHLMDCVN